MVSSVRSPRCLLCHMGQSAPVSYRNLSLNVSCRAVTYLAGLSCATILYNVVESPVGTVPVTRVDPELDTVTSEWTDPTQGSGHGSHLIESLLYKGKTPFYDSKKMAGLPIGVQVVGKKWEDEKVVEMMKVLDVALGSKRGFAPGSWTSTKV